MANLIGPYQIEFELSGWNTPIRVHMHRVNVIAVGSPPLGTLPTAIDIQKQGGATAKLNVVANQYWEFVRLLYPAAITCVGYTFWRIVTGTSGKDFVTSGNVTNPAGTNAGGVQLAQQLTFSYRSANGGIMKQVFLEPSISGDVRQILTPNVAGTAQQRMAAYILSADNIALAADDGFIISALRESRGQNERIWRLLFR